MTRIYIDYSNAGAVSTGDHFTTRLLSHERRELHEGDVIEVYGDTVDARQAVVVKVDPTDPVVEFALVGD